MAKRFSARLKVSSSVNMNASQLTPLTGIGPVSLPITAIFNFFNDTNITPFFAECVRS